MNSFLLSPRQHQVLPLDSDKGSIDYKANPVVAVIDEMEEETA